MVGNAEVMSIANPLPGATSGCAVIRAQSPSFQELSHLRLDDYLYKWTLLLAKHFDSTLE
jgi:hypothetical protein